jgi:hypothetical protein
MCQFLRYPVLSIHSELTVPFGGKAMPDIRVSIPHQLGKPEALKRVRTLLTNVKRNHGDQVNNLQERWHDNGARFSFNAMGFDVSGELIVGEREVTVTGKLPWLAGMFKGQIEDTIRDQASELLV